MAAPGGLGGGSEQGLGVRRGTDSSPGGSRGGLSELGDVFMIGVTNILGDLGGLEQICGMWEDLFSMTEMLGGGGSPCPMPESGEVLQLVPSSVDLLRLSSMAVEAKETI